LRQNNYNSPNLDRYQGYPNVSVVVVWWRGVF